MRHAGIIFFAMCAILCGCQKPLTEAEVKVIGQKYLDTHAPQWKDEYSLPSVVIDRGDVWKYTFQLPENTWGGTPSVYIDKKTLQVTKMFHQQ